MLRWRSVYARVAAALVFAAFPICAAPAAVAPNAGTAQAVWKTTPAYDENGKRLLAVDGSRLFADAGSDLEALDLDRGTVLWRRGGVQTFRLLGQNLFAGSAGSIVALTTNGHELWERPACSGSDSVRDVAISGARLFVLCIGRDNAFGDFAALDAENGALLYRSVRMKEHPNTIEIVGPSVLVRESFSGAYDGEYEEFFDPADGRPIARFQDRDVLTARGNRVLLNDRSRFDIGNAHEPAFLSWLDLTTGKETKRVPLPPPESGDAFGPTFVANDWLYLKLGPTMYRYRLPDFRRREVVMTDAGELYYVGPAAAVLAVSGQPKNQLVDLTLTGASVAARPIAQLDTAIDFKREGVLAGDSPFTIDNGGNPYLVDAQHARVYGFDRGCAATAAVLVDARRAAVLCDLWETTTFKGVSLRLYELRN